MNRCEFNQLLRTPAGLRGPLLERLHEVLEADFEAWTYLIHGETETCLMGAIQVQDDGDVRVEYTRSGEAHPRVYLLRMSDEPGGGLELVQRPNLAA